MFKKWLHPKPKNIFVLCTGRCGSTTFIKACGHITNYSAGHETRCRRLGDDRLAYPVSHIEADNRLSWMLGRLEEAFGDEPLYVHLTRNEEETGRSFTHRYGSKVSIIEAYHSAILMGAGTATELEVSNDYVRTVNENIKAFLRNKPHKMQVRLEALEDDFAVFWERIGAQGDIKTALSECQIKHNLTMKSG